MKKTKTSFIVGGMAVSLLSVSSNSVLAQVVDDQASIRENTRSGLHVKNHRNPGLKAESLAAKFGLDPNEVKSEFAAGKTPRQILAEHGITRKASVRPHHEKRKFGNAKFMRKSV
jgi:hypothetical protein